jgi:hypothetical protein
MRRRGFSFEAQLSGDVAIGAIRFRKPAHTPPRAALDSRALLRNVGSICFRRPLEGCSLSRESQFNELYFANSGS